ncbi:MAG: phosphopantothenate/pantothenate synthetase [Candidatus Thermoplasmatota archaeon]|jgi:4-phosphopantoate--beta-alanine ligase|nr:phosphopantothenate/pantothenate synthetase [Candidatus Thermoplasmatota archaeon]
MDIPESHPRYLSLTLRERITQGMKDGLVAPAGLAAHGRGEAFDYLLGEYTIPEAREQARAAAAALLLSKSPVISVNGNSTVLASVETIELAAELGAKIEVNLFHSSEERVAKLVSFFEDKGASDVLGTNRNSLIPGIDHNRGGCCSKGIYSADTVLVLLEDGDRTRALKEMGKLVIAVDLNPLSRTARTCDIPVIDNITRALPEITRKVKEMRPLSREELKSIIDDFSNDLSLRKVIHTIAERLKKEY